MPYITNHTYKINWGFGLDFTSMRLTMSSRWTFDDLPINLMFNFTDVRAAVYMDTGNDVIANDTLNTVANGLQQTGDNVVYNDTDTREIWLLINGQNYTRNPVVMEGVRCIGGCLSSVTAEPIESDIRYWSNASSWDNGTIPLAGANVEIMPGWNMVLDLNVTPIFNIIQINGRLSFLNNSNIHLQANYVFVRAGELWIGNETNPFVG